jgi:hypothetical protein
MNLLSCHPAHVALHPITRPPTHVTLHEVAGSSMNIPMDSATTLRFAQNDGGEWSAPLSPCAPSQGLVSTSTAQWTLL